jgi:ribosomal protein S18 acetylase RimI-like enzyme
MPHHAAMGFKMTHALKTHQNQYDVAAMLANCRQYWLNYSQAPHSDGPIAVYRTGVPHHQLNGVIHMNAASDDEIREVVSQLSDLPSVWWVGPDSYPTAAEDVISAGAKLSATLPVMAIQLHKLAQRPIPSPHWTIVRLQEGAALFPWVQSYSEAVGARKEDIATMLRVEQNRSDAPGQLTRFAAFSDGEIVGTSELFVHEGIAGIYLVSTKKSHRCRGIGTALTHAASMAGRELGLDVATLQASSSGYPIYKKLGFEDVASYDLLTFDTAEVLEEGGSVAAAPCPEPTTSFFG